MTLYTQSHVDGIRRNVLSVLTPDELYVLMSALDTQNEKMFGAPDEWTYDECVALTMLIEKASDEIARREGEQQ